MASQASRPNLLVVVLDSVRADRLSCYGYPQATSPELDRLAGEGVRFTSALSECNWTLPVAVSLLTGLTPREHRAEFHRRLPRDMPSVVDLLGEAGYATYCGTANGFLGPRRGLSRGFSAFRMPARHGRLTHHLARYVVRPMGWTDEGGKAVLGSFLRWAERTPGPWFGLLWLIESHYPYLSPQPYMNRFADPPLPYARRLELANRMRRPQHLVSTASPEDLRDISSLYNGAVSYGDTLLGRLRQGMTQRGLWDEATTVIMADHGDMLGERGLMGHGSCSGVYQPLVRIPLAVHSPHVAAGTVSDSLVQVTDVTQTVCELAGVADLLPPSAAPRCNLLAAAAGQGRRAALCEHDAPGPRASLRERRRAPDYDFEPHMCHEAALLADGWKLIVRSDGRNELYDLATDPLESTNRLTDEPARAAALTTLMKNLQGKARPHASTAELSVDEEAIVEKRLQDLGYV